MAVQRDRARNADDSVALALFTDETLRIVNAIAMANRLVLVLIAPGIDLVDEAEAVEAIRDRLAGVGIRRCAAFLEGLPS